MIAGRLHYARRRLHYARRAYRFRQLFYFRSRLSSAGPGARPTVAKAGARNPSPKRAEHVRDRSRLTTTAAMRSWSDNSATTKLEKLAVIALHPISGRHWTGWANFVVGVMPINRSLCETCESAEGAAAAAVRATAAGEVGALQMLHKPPRHDLRHDLICVVRPLAALEAQREGERRGEVFGRRGGRFVGEVGHAG